MNLTFTRSKETAALLAFFSEMTIGAVVPFKDASRRLGFELGPTKGAYQSARRIAVKECGVVIETVRGIGFKRLSGEDIAIGRGAYRAARARRQATWCINEMSVALSMNLPREVAAVAEKHHQRSSIMGDLATPIRVESNKTVVPEPEKAERVDPRAQLARAFGL